MRPKIAICVGHSRHINGHVEGGAISVGGVSEWNYNVHLAELVARHLREVRIEPLVVTHYEGESYGQAQTWLAGFLKAEGVVGAIENHFNASDDPKSTGHEMLYWHSSTKGQALANALENNFCLAVPELKKRGSKPRFEGDRGADFLKKTHCPAVIVESFFGSNPDDWRTATTQREKIAQAIANGIADVF